MDRSSAARMTGGEAMAFAAAANGTEIIFGVPGAQIYALFEGIYRSEMKLVVPRHEQAAAYMAMGYAKASGKTGVYCVVPGPGVLNTAAALCTAMGNCTPLVCLTGQIPSEYLGKGRGHLHEVADQRGTLKTLIKDAVRIDSPRLAPSSVDHAFQTARSGRPGPVAVEMCWDRLACADEIEIGSGKLPRLLPPIDLDAIDRAAKLIAAAKKPMIMCGAGAQHASESVLALAEKLNAPVTAFRSGRGVVPEDHPLAAPPVAARELWDDVDLLIGIGSRLEMPYMRWRDPMRYEAKPSGGPKLLRIDIEASEFDRLKPDCGLHADADQACRLLYDRLQKNAQPNKDRSAEIEAANRLARSLFSQIQPQAAYLETIRAVMPRSGYLVPELSQVGFTTYTGAYPVLAPRTYVSEGHQGTLGFGFPTALGVKLARPEEAVVSITGDGGLMFGIQELATAAQYRIGLVTVVFNNGAYANVVRDQQSQFDGHVIGSVFENPNFVSLAESFGVQATRVDSPEGLRQALESALAENAPSLIEVVIEPGSEASPWHLIHMNRRPSQL